MEKQRIQAATIAAVEATDQAAKVIGQFLSSGDWQVHNKADNTPVTEVDIAAEVAIKKVLDAAPIGADFYGEETGRTERQQADDSDAAQLLWLVDPIDGTKSFVRQSPFYSTQIALMENDELIVGVSNAPAFGERLVASRGNGVQLNGVNVQSNDNVALKDAYLSTGNLATIASDSRHWSSLAKLVTQVKRTRGYGDFCHYHQLCCGQCDLIVESDVNILDIAALYVGVVEAGGVMTDLQGQPIGLQTTSVLAASTQSLHRSALQLLSA
jgi:histidinol-phosphatase